MKTIDKWYMTDDEIRRSWRKAADKAEQIKIIAELNARTKEDVMKKLVEIGEELPENMRTSGRKAKYKISDADERKIWKERFKGTPYWKIARMLGGTASESAVQIRYEKMRGDYLKALPTVKKALNTFVEAIPTEDSEIVKAFVRRYL